MSVSADSAAASVRVRFIAGMIVFGALLRLICARGDLWVDEIMTLKILGLVDGPLHLFAFAHDNNHLLNSLWAYAVTSAFQDPHPVVFRFLSVVSGAVAIAAAAAVVGPRNRHGQMVAATFFAVSFLMVNYGSEARGYAPAIALVLLGVCAHQRYQQHESRKWGGVFGGVMALALLAHVGVVAAYGAIAIWGAVRHVRQRAWSDLRRELILCHPLPLLTVAWLKFSFLVDVISASPPPGDLLQVGFHAAALTVGVDAGPAVNAICAVVLLLMFSVSLRRIEQAGSTRTVLYALGVVLPVALLLFRPQQFVAVRFLLISSTFCLLLFAEALGYVLAQRQPTRLLAAGLVVAFCIFNVAPVASLVRHGRGSYLAAIDHLYAKALQPRVTVEISDHIGSALVLDHYLQGRSDGDRMQIVPQYETQPVSAGAQWYIVDDLPGERAKRPEMIKDGRGNTYLRSAHFPTSTLSGVSWTLYRLEP